ncbi:MAG: Ppx/GppA phosphatase family protein [Rubrivivax sp.]
MTDDTPLAAIDIGSNSFRLEVARIHRGRYRRVSYFKRMVRLGAGLDAESRLDEEAMRRGLDCLAEIAAGLQGLDRAHVRAVATQTLREAANRNAFLARAQPVLGHPIEVISGREEARLIYAGASFLSPSDASRLVIDIGGRSTELILGTGREPAEAESFAVGSGALSARWFADGSLSAAAFRDAQVAAGAEFEEALETFSPMRWSEALGCSGTVGAISELLEASDVTDGRITPQGLAWLIERAVAAGHVSRLQLPGLKDERRPVLAGGLAILYTLMAQFGIRELQPSKGALRQGVIVDLHQRLAAAQPGSRQRDLRDATVHDLQQRFAIDRAQAARVRQAALDLYDALQPQAPAELRRELGWVCELHEIGFLLSHHDHHRHAAYMLAHVGAPGFSQDQLRRLAALALGQRGGLRKVQDLLADDATRWQLLCLRLAVIQCHDRGVFGRRAFRVSRSEGSTVRLQGPARDAAADLHMRYLLQEEAQAWQRQGALRLRVD